MVSVQPWRGAPYPLGASWDGQGVNFALFSENATGVELCLFDEGGERRLQMADRTDQVWHAYLPGLHPGQRYGYRLSGPWSPDQGHRFNPAKLLVDPYARLLDGAVSWAEALVGHRADADGGIQPDERDSAPHMPKGVVIDPAFAWGPDRQPATPWEETVIYEVHVKGFTRQHPDLPPELRGTYAGLASEPAIDHLQRLGVTAVELLPVHQHATERHLVERGLTNYWGYNTIGFFAPERSLAATDDPVGEFRAMVRRLHQAGIEVILDVVYNHTAEGDHDGPTLSFRGIDNAAYYRLDPDDPSRYVDYTGTGNTLNAVHPRTLQLIMDSLRYWIAEMHVDGFRFDLASALARELHDVDKLGSFFDIVHQDPMISQVKLIAEPWDVGPGGYQVGNFPIGWAEWNGKYRDTVRRFWRGTGGQAAELAYRLTGSSDLYAEGGRLPHASINFVTAHDGFTLADLVSYERKHNEANGEGNRDGDDHGESMNFGVEGQTDDPAIVERRARQQRSFLATLLLSQGVPMLLGGDEMGRTQAGNNNAYAQDNPISWFDWHLTDADRQLLDFTRGLLAVFRAHPVLRRRHFFQGRRIRGSRVKDLTWFDPGGDEMTDEQWQAERVHAIGLRLAGDAIDERGPRGERIVDDTLLLLLNANEREVDFRLPSAAGVWRLVLDTRSPDPPVDDDGPAHAGGSTYRMLDRSVALFRLPRAG
jgi:glycogen operon protein